MAMEPIKSFEAFIADSYQSIPANEEVKFDRDDLKDSKIPESARKKLWEFVHECMESGVLYESDDDKAHTLEEFMIECGEAMASATIKSLKQNRSLIAIAAKSPINEEDDADPLEVKGQIQEYVRGRLDSIHGKMLEGFTKGINRAKDDNNGIAAMVASEMMKDEQ